MKTILLILSALFLASCTAEEIPQQYYKDVQYCGLIVSTGEDQRGDYIEVKMPYHQAYDKDRYKVANYMDYKLNQEICDFSGLVKQPL